MGVVCHACDVLTLRWAGGVFNITVTNCSFGGYGSDFAGVHLKTTRGSE